MNQVSFRTKIRHCKLSLFNSFRDLLMTFALFGIVQFMNCCVAIIACYYGCKKTYRTDNNISEFLNEFRICVFIIFITNSIHT